MNISAKVLAILIIVACSIAVFAVMVAANLFGLGDALAGAGGPVAAGIYNLAIGPVNWALTGGWPTLAVFYLIGIIVVPFTFAYIIWHFDVPYKISGATAVTPANDYTNTMKREPDEPERSPAI
jgi:hypothetical protein